MNILVIGSGGREHALGLKLKQSNDDNNLLFLPGNAGTMEIGENIESTTDYKDIVNICKKRKIDLVVIGPEQPLVDGLTNILVKNDIKVFGPTAEAAIIEGEKSFAKDLMKKYKIPTAAYKVFTKDEKQNVLKYLDEISYPIVIKANGLAAGKGVTICSSKDESQNVVEEYFDNSRFGEAGEKIVIEDYLIGEEASVFILTDGTNYLILPPSQDHKRIYDFDKGPNTGGMGAYAPANVITEDLLKQVETEIIIPTLNGMLSENRKFEGCLYCGLIITEEGPKVIEYNARFGDPETQSVLSLIEGRFDKLLLSIANGKVDKKSINIKDKYAVNVVAASSGYPGFYEKGKLITGIDEVDENVDIIHAGTKILNGEIYTNGGRVLSINAVANSLKEAKELAYKNIKRIHFDGIYFRNDIASKGIKD